MATKKNTEPEVTTPEVNTPEVTENVNPAMDAPVTEAQIAAERNAAAQSIRQEERVPIFIERAHGNDDPNLFVSVNGYNCLLPKGKTSMVPKSIYDEIMRAREAQQRLDETIDALKEAAAQQPV